MKLLLKATATGATLSLVRGKRKPSFRIKDLAECKAERRGLSVTGNKIAAFCGLASPV